MFLGLSKRLKKIWRLLGILVLVFIHQQHHIIMRQNLVLMVLLCSDIFTIYFLKGLLFNKSIADSSSCLVLYLLRKKGGLLNSLLISANFSCLFLSYKFLYFLTLAIMLNSPQKTMVMVA
jgi:hypothetical protein